jgi:hypothetical protein
MTPDGLIQSENKKKKIWMHRLKSFELHGINKMVDFTRISTGYY